MPGTYARGLLDPACGTAGFLISSYKHIRDANAQTPLSAEERTQLAQNIVGYDISPDMVRLSLVNLYLHGFPQPQILEYDTLTSDDRWNQHADVILANPPFMSPKGGIKPHTRFGVQSSRSEVLFVDYIAEHLTPTGRAGVIVPEGIIFQSGSAYKTLRKMLVEKHLVAVVSLPAGVFQPYSGVKTSILILDSALAKTSDSVLFVKIASDGFGLGAQRRAVAQNDLPEAARVLASWRDSLRNKTPFDAAGSEMAQVVAKAKIGESGDYNLSGDRYLNSLIIDSDYPRISLGDACKIYNGSTPSKEVKEYWHEGTGIVSSTFCKSVEYPSSAAKLGFYSFCSVGASWNVR
jgi:type I restriction enzyme M protein